MRATDSCPFRRPDSTRTVAQEELTVIYPDGFPVSPGHTLIFPRRHIATLFEATDAEQAALLKALNRAKAILDDSYTLVFSLQVAGGEETKHALLERHGKPLLKPQSKDYLPAGQFLDWHEKEVFKRPARLV